MKQCWIAVALLAVITAACCFWVWKAEDFTESVAVHVQQAQISAESGSLEQALTSLQQAHRQWESGHLLFGAMMRHQESDEIAVAFSSAETSLRFGQREDFLVLCTELVSTLRHIADMEAPKLYNIL